MSTLHALLDALTNQSMVLVRVASVQGSGPRDVGAWMAVGAAHTVDTIGGGHLELQAIRLARAALHSGVCPPQQRFALGPSLGQCCGGVVELSFELLQTQDRARLMQQLCPPRLPLALFGGGHVGKALVRVLAPLPFQVTWIDSRDEIFPPDVPAHVQCEHSDPVQAAVDDLAPGSCVLIMSFSHAEDLDILSACLQRARAQQDLPYIGLIGSQTKWATFRHRLEERGFNDADFARVTCPIGLPHISGKEPEVIAVSVAAQLLQTATASA